MTGNEYVRHGDPGTSHRAVRRLTPNLPKRQAECYDVCARIAPCTRNEIRQQAQDDGHSPSVAETIRRRATDLIRDGHLYVVSGSGDCEVLDFVGPPGTVTHLGSQGHPPVPPPQAAPARRRLVRRRVPVEPVPVPPVRRLRRRRVGDPR